MTVHPLDFEDAYARTRKLSEQRRSLVDQYEDLLKKAADAQQDYRRALAIAHINAAADPDCKTATARDVKAKDLASDAEREASIADAMVKATLERIRAVEADRAMLNTLVSWSIRLTPMGAEA